MKCVQCETEITRLEFCNRIFQITFTTYAIREAFILSILLHTRRKNINQNNFFGVNAPNLILSISVVQLPGIFASNCTQPNILKVNLAVVQEEKCADQ